MQGPWILYGRDGKFRASFKRGTEKQWFSALLLMTWCHQTDLPKSRFTPRCTLSVALVAGNAPHCTDLHLGPYFQKIFAVPITVDVNVDVSVCHNDSLKCLTLLWPWPRPLDLQNLMASPLPRPLPLGARPPSHFFRASAAAAHTLRVNQANKTVERVFL